MLCSPRPPLHLCSCLFLPRSQDCGAPCRCREMGAGLDGDTPERECTGWRGADRQPVEHAVPLHNTKDLCPIKEVAQRQPKCFLETCSSGDPHVLLTDRCLYHLQQGKNLSLRNPTTDLARGGGIKPARKMDYYLLYSPLIIYLCPFPGWLLRGSFISVILSQHWNFGRGSHVSAASSLLSIYLY